MRLTKLLVVISLLLILNATAGAASSQLTNVSVAPQARATTVTLHASGSFTHTEYRPVDNLLLVDLVGVAPGKLKDSMQAVNRAGINSYRVLGYAGAGGNEVTRVEMSIASGSVVTVSEVAGGLMVNVTSNSEAPVVAASKPETAPAAPKPAPASVKTTVAPAPKSPQSLATSANNIVTVQHVAVKQGEQGIEIEIASSGPVTPKAMTLHGPDRLVLDIPNALPASTLRSVNVNGADVKSIRTGRFQDDPPVTRIVVDLVAARDYELQPGGNKLIVKLRGNSEAVLAKAKPVQPKTEVAKPAETASKPTAEPAKPAPTVSASAPPKTESPKAEAPKPQPTTVAKAEPATPQPTRTEPKPAAETAKSAQDFVMVEPKYETKPATDSDPKAAAQAAAGVIKNGDPRRDLGLLPQPSASLGAPAVNMAAQQQQQQQNQPNQLPTANLPPAQHYTGEPISVNLKDVDLKDFFRLI